MAQIKNITIKFKRAYAASWPRNYVLADGEPGFELDTGKLKIGDGITTWEDLPYADATIFMKDFESAELGQVPSKAQDGAITWITPLTESNIINSTAVNSWLENKISETSSRTYKGEASLLSQENGVITLFDSNYNPIVANTNDVYSYEETKYLWTGTEWVELTKNEVYATAQSVSQLTSRVAALENGAITALATEQDAGAVKSSNDINKIKVNSDGTMSINSIGINKLVNNGYTLILDSGQSN